MLKNLHPRTRQGSFVAFRPGRHGSSGFMLPTSQIKPTVEETWDGITAMANEIHKEY